MGRSPETFRKGRLLPLKVWDLPTRLFHWLLVALLAAAWFTGEEGEMEWHARIGQAILVLILFRVLWGLVGSQTARFWNFVRGPRTVLAHAKALLTGRTERSVGHNPLGSWMILVLIALVTAQAILGLFANDDIFFEGPLRTLVSKETSDTLTSIHKTLFNVILAAVAIHIAASVFYLVVKRENLIGPMITGSKWWPAPLPRLKMTPAWVALPLLAIAAATVWAAIEYA